MKLKIRTRLAKEGRQLHLTTTHANATNLPVLMIKLKAAGEKSRVRMLPVFLSDNFVSLVPGESRTIKMELQEADTRGESPIVIVEGFNRGKE